MFSQSTHQGKKDKISAFQHKSWPSQAYLLSRCSARVILITSGLWFAQASYLKAMEPEFYKDAKHPLTQKFWKERDLSERLKALKDDLEQKKKEINASEANSLNITETELNKYKNILKCTECCGTNFVSELKNIHLNNLIICDNPRKPNSGWSSGIKVLIFHENGQDLIAIKQFDDIKKGLEELFYSLIALELNPEPQKIKMARIYDAIICPHNSLSIIMEAVTQKNIHSFLSKNSALDAVRACAKYLATFHIENHHKLGEKVDGKKHLKHVAQLYNALQQDTLKEEDPVYKLLDFNPREPLSKDQRVQSNNVIFLLPKEKQDKFKKLVKNVRCLFQNNVGEIFRVFENNKKLETYFLTRTHGDAHAHNFFYDDSVLLNGLDIPRDSLLRVSMIDFASIIKTYWGIGDPAEDVGRFLAALWNWRAIEQKNDNNEWVSDEKAAKLQRKFLNCYLETIKNSSIIGENNQKEFEKTFKESCSFYELRYYRVLFNAKKAEDLEKDKEIKQRFLESWIEENAYLESSSEMAIQQDISREKSRGRHWKPVCTSQENITHWLPERSEVFIESADKESNTSYLTRLWEMLEYIGNVTVSSTATIAGMGGVGKTSLALEYAHEALANKAYDLIYWIYSGTEISLFNSYKSLLEKMKIYTKNLSKEEVIDYIKQEVPKRGKRLLIYDNVPPTYGDIPAPNFLKNLTPENKYTHILMTSRYNEGWGKAALNLNVFRKEDSINYLFEVTGLERTLENEKIAGELSDALDHFPLALAHTAHYLKLEGGKKVSKKHFTDYLTAFREEPDIHFEKNRNPITEFQSEITYENLIGKTLRMARKRLLPLAEQLLTYFAYLSPDAIEEDIFLEYWDWLNQKNLKEDQALGNDAVRERIFLEAYQKRKDFKTALSQLSDLSLIKRVENQPLFSMHRLLQFVIYNEKRVKFPQQNQEVIKELAHIFNTVFEINTYTSEKVEKFINYFPHMIQLIPRSKDVEKVCAKINRFKWTFIISYIVLNSQIKYEQKTIKKKNIEILNISKTLFESFIIDGNVPDWLIKIAAKGHPMIQTALGVMYQKGIYISENNYEEAYYWYTEAANQNHVMAQCLLGSMYEVGEGVHKDSKKAFNLYSNAAEGGSLLAQSLLGSMYEQGKGIPKDQVKAFDLFAKAAVQGSLLGQFLLGSSCICSGDTNQDVEKGLDLLMNAATQGSIYAQRLLSVIDTVLEMAPKKEITTAWMEKMLNYKRGFANGLQPLPFEYDWPHNVLNALEIKKLSEHLAKFFIAITFNKSEIKKTPGSTRVVCISKGALNALLEVLASRVEPELKQYTEMGELSDDLREELKLDKALVSWAAMKDLPEDNPDKLKAYEDILAALKPSFKHYVEDETINVNQRSSESYPR